MCVSVPIEGHEYFRTRELVMRTCLQVGHRQLLSYRRDTGQFGTFCFPFRTKKSVSSCHFCWDPAQSCYICGKKCHLSGNCRCGSVCWHMTCSVHMTGSLHMITTVTTVTHDQVREVIGGWSCEVFTFYCRFAIGHVKKRRSFEKPCKFHSKATCCTFSTQ